MQKRRLVTLVTVAIVIPALLVAGVLIRTAALRSRRLHEVRVQLGTTLDRHGDLASILTMRLTGEPNPVAADVTIQVYDSARELASSSTGRGSPELPESQIDVLLAALAFGEPHRTAVVATDPYIVIADTRAGASPTASDDATIATMERWLAALDDGSRTPLAVAGDEPPVFAAFILWLAASVLSESAYDAVVDSLVAWDRAGDAAPVSDDALRSLVDRTAPVVELLGRWRSAAILAPNWTDWDEIALTRAVAEGRTALAFSLRGSLGSFEFDERFHLRVHRLPVGEDRRSYRMFGHAVGVTPGEGVRADAAEAIVAALHEGSVQEQVEARTRWSPVAIEGAPRNREHRDVVRWFRGASGYLVVDETIAAHPLFARLHALLR